MEVGQDRGLAPIGLAARDTLRFEMGYCLYGNDINDETTPLEAGLGWTVKLDKKQFIGRETLVRQKETGLSRRLVGIRPDAEKTIPRQGYSLTDGGVAVGTVTSGTFSPSLGRGMGMGYVEVSRARKGTKLDLDVRGRSREVTVVRPPFYSGGSRKPPVK